MIKSNKQWNQITESPDEYPSSSSTTPVGRRGSYKSGRGWCWFTFYLFSFCILLCFYSPFPNINHLKNSNLSEPVNHFMYEKRKSFLIEDESFILKWHVHENWVQMPKLSQISQTGIFDLVEIRHRRYDLLVASIWSTLKMPFG